MINDTQQALDVSLLLTSDVSLLLTSDVSLLLNFTSVSIIDSQFYSGV